MSPTVFYKERFIWMHSYSWKFLFMSHLFYVHQEPIIIFSICVVRLRPATPPGTRSDTLGVLSGTNNPPVQNKSLYWIRFRKRPGHSFEWELLQFTEVSERRVGTIHICPQPQKT